MAYLQITTRCNMLCPHCCFSATNKGEDMTQEVFMQSLQLIARYDGIVTIGGGEPTCHKHFFDFLDKAIEVYEQGKLELPPLVITNGKLKGKALKMLDYVEGGKSMSVELSQDEWHDPIDPEVVRVFSLHHQASHAQGKSYAAKQYVSAGIRTATKLGAWGRAADPPNGLQTDSALGKCCCEEMVFAPDGTIWSCGCKIHKLGSVFDPEAELNTDLREYDRDFAPTGGFETVDGLYLLMEHEGAA